MFSCFDLIVIVIVHCYNQMGFVLTILFPFQNTTKRLQCVVDTEINSTLVLNLLKYRGEIDENKNVNKQTETINKKYEKYMFIRTNHHLTANITNLSTNNFDCDQLITKRNHKLLEKKNVFDLFQSSVNRSIFECEFEIYTLHLCRTALHFASQYKCFHC